MYHQSYVFLFFMFDYQSSFEMIKVAIDSFTPTGPTDPQMFFL